MKLVAFALSLFVFTVSARADLEIHSVFQDHMVLQRHREIPITGRCDSGATITAGIDGRSATTVAGDDGRFTLTLPSLTAGGPHELTIRSNVGDEIRIQDVLVGEVWLCSGQSNMQWSVDMGIDHGEAEAAAADHPTIRLLHMPLTGDSRARDHIDVKWAACTPKTMREFSAAGYFFGRRLRGELGVPIGLIDAAFGGTPAASWTPRSALAAAGGYESMLEKADARVAEWDEKAQLDAYRDRMIAWRKQVEQAKADGTKHPAQPFPYFSPVTGPIRPANLYNALIAPFTNYPIAGVIWYQGESDQTRAAMYRELFPLMIRSWREKFGRPDLPFYFVQLASFRHRTGTTPWAELQDAQQHTEKTVPGTGMVVITDISDVDNIHPTNKQDVGLRLANLALADTYGRTDIAYRGPRYRQARFHGSQAVIEFDHVASGLTTRGGAAPSHLEMAGADRVFHPAVGRIEHGRLIVTSDHVAEPVAVRFAWDGAAEPNLINGDGLPASLFRTDAWPLTTEGAPIW